MYGTVLHGPSDIRYEELPEPAIVKPTDAIIRTVATCVCGSDLWGYRGQLNPGKVFDLTLPLDQVTEGHRAMDERRAIKTLLRP
jgi:threonine dehydrogenase-like Zn-dependent dehydrogenase